jgi:undecaprenyl-diphosphatase
MLAIGFLATMSGWVGPFVERLNEHLTRPFNSLAGRSWLFDSLVSLPLENDLVKAALVGACFYAAWHEHENPVQATATRKLLLVALCAAALTITTTKILSHTVLLPRPLVQTQQLYYLEEGRLVANAPAAIRLPLDKESRQAQRNLLNGDVDINDLGSFPSDHAGLFFSLAFGIWLASRRYGRWALAWVVLVVIQAKLISGQHTMLDALGGIATGAAVVLACRWTARLAWPDRILTRLVELAEKHRALSSAMLFVIVFEVANTLTHIRHLLKFAAEAGRYLLKG